MAKKIKASIKLQISAGLANPSPPIGPALGQHGINIMEFCKSFNKRTEHFERGILVTALITVYSDRSFSFHVKDSPVSVLLKKAIGISSGSSKPSREHVGKINISKIREIAKRKRNEMTGSNIEAIARSIMGTARSMGLEIEEHNETK